MPVATAPAKVAMVPRPAPVQVKPPAPKVVTTKPAFIVDGPALMGKPWRVARLSLKRFTLTETDKMPDYETDPDFSGGKDYVYTSAPAKDKDSLPQQISVTISASGDVTRITALNMEGLGLPLDKAPEALAKLNITGLSEPDVSAPMGRRWRNVSGLAVSALTSEQGGPIWQMQVVNAGHD